MRISDQSGRHYRLKPTLPRLDLLPIAARQMMPLVPEIDQWRDGASGTERVAAQWMVGYEHAADMPPL